MEGNDLIQYIHLANDLYEGNITGPDLLSRITHLPHLDQTLLLQLTQQAESFATSKPRRTWTVMCVAYHTSVAQNSDLFLQSLAAFHLARACNQWTQPKRVKEAIAIARRGFTALNEAVWLSACDWQENALTWTQPNFAESAQRLKEALSGLEQKTDPKIMLKAASPPPPPSGMLARRTATGAFFGWIQNEFERYIPECRLSLAYAQILIGEHEDALENIRLCEETYAAQGDPLNQARCWLYRASSLRRRDKFPEAHQVLEKALEVFEEFESSAEAAKARYQMALGHLLKTDELPLAVEQFTKAAELFQDAELDLWHALCTNNLGGVYLFTGELTLADKYLQQANAVFAQHEVIGLLADNLNDQGEVNILRGRPQTSVEQFNSAVALNEGLGSRLSAAITLTNLGKAYGHGGRYQDALFHLEQASGQLEALHSHLRLGTCEKYAALIWSHLGQPDVAHEHLDRAIANYEAAEQDAMLCEVHNIRATAFFQQGRNEDALSCLKESLGISSKHGVRPQTALARRLLGEALTKTGNAEEALEHLAQAYAEFSDMGMQMDMAACLTAMGTCHTSQAEHDQAWEAFQQALELSDGILPDIEWQSRIGLGNLARSKADTDEALVQYRQAVNAFSRIHQNFWQAGLAGSYLQNPSRTFDEIISFTSEADSAKDVLSFIETSKASTLLRQLLSDNPVKQNATSQELSDLEAEILFLQDQLRSSLDKPFPVQVGGEFKKIRARLAEKTGQFEKLKSQLERQVTHKQVSATSYHDSFDVSVFQGMAEDAVPQDWFALDYYLTEDAVVMAVIAPDLCEVTRTPLTHRVRTALEACKRNSTTATTLTQGDLDTLGKLLIPARLAERLNPETTLLISPHRDLHTVPWAALTVDASSKMLVQSCIPVIVPSLQSSMMLWQRDKTSLPKTQNGLAIGLSSFGGKRRELPNVKEEIAFLSSRVGSDGVCLAEAEAGWENLITLNQASVNEVKRGLSHFDWTHIATHFFPHTQTGRLSGFALADGDVWLDKLRDLAPLPPLVTISACNGLSSFVYEGDEHVDLPSLCLTAGAQRVVGSIWPVLDHVAVKFTKAFYTYVLNGMDTAEAVAQTQRDMISQGFSTGKWAGFMCIGVP